MELTKGIFERRSIRKYKNTPVPRESLEKIMEAVNMAPTACNRQPFKFFLISNSALRAEIGKSYYKSYLAEAPYVVVVAGDENGAWHRPDGESIASVDCAIALDHFILAATAEGLASCWICAFDRAIVDKALALPEKGLRPIAMTPLGFADGEPVPFQRKGVKGIMEEIS